MADFPYTLKTSSLSDLLEKISRIGVPTKVTHKYIKSLGYTSSNDSRLIGILKDLKFIEDSGTPTERWSNFRDKEHGPYVLAEAIMDAYPALFHTYPDAYRKDDEALRAFFTSNSSVGEKVVSRMVGTFKVLCEAAIFDKKEIKSSKDKPKESSIENQPTTKVVQNVKGDPSSQPVTINVNLQFTLPETKDNSIYEAIFESLKKNFLS